MLLMASLAAFVSFFQKLVDAAARPLSSPPRLLINHISPKFGWIRGGASLHEKGGAEHASAVPRRTVPAANARAPYGPTRPREIRKKDLGRGSRTVGAA